MLKKFLSSLLLSASLTTVTFAEFETNYTVRYDRMENGLVVTELINSNGHKIERHVDGAGHVRKEVDGSGIPRTYEYDANGNMVKMRKEGIGVDCTYDSLNRRKTMTHTDGRTWSWTYDQNSNILTATNPRGDIESWEYDSLDRQKKHTDTLGHSTQFTFDANSNNTSLTDPLDKTTYKKFDALNRLIEASFEAHDENSAPGDASYDKVITSYDALNRPSKKTLQDGSYVTWSYNLVGELTSRKYYTSVGTLESEDTFEYDKASRLTKATKGRYNNTIEFDYDGAGRRIAIKQTVNGITRVIGMSYTGSDLTGYSMPGNALITSISNTWNSRHQLTSITATTTHGQKIVSSTYDDYGREASRTFANNIVKTFNYIAGGSAISSISVPLMSAAEFSYSYDSNFMPTSESRISYSFTNWRSSFDKEDRLLTYNKTGHDEIRVLDAIGNVTSRTLNGTVKNQSFDDTYQMTASGTEVQSFDPKGNRIATAGQQAIWDLDNQLKEIKDGQGNLIASYEYDALGRRIAKVLANSTRIDMLLNKDNQVCAEYTTLSGGTATCTASYLFASYIDDAVMVVTPSDCYSIHRDRQFNTRAITDSVKQLIERIEYTPSGIPKAYDGTGAVLTQTAFPGSSFTGRYYDTESGLHYFRSRYFDPVKDSFINRDSMGYVDGYSMYVGYFSGQMLLDPSGTNTKGVLVDVDKGGKEERLDGLEEATHIINNTGECKVKDSTIRETLKNFYFQYFKLREVQYALTELSKKDKGAYARLQKKGVIRWNGEVFDGTQKEYLRLIKHELESELIVVRGGGIKQIEEAMKEAASSKCGCKVETEDKTVFIAHGYPGGRYMEIDGKKTSSDAVLEALRRAVRASAKTCYYISCHHNSLNHPEKAIVGVKAPAGHTAEAFVSRDKETNEIIGFNGTALVITPHTQKDTPKGAPKADVKPMTKEDLAKKNLK